jgi:hypothetical protein
MMMPAEENQTIPQVAKSDNKFWILLSCALILLTSIPYIYAEMISNGRDCTLAGSNVPDYSVYLTWSALAKNGILFDPHLYTTNASVGMLINPAYLVIGWISALFHLPIIVGYQVGRCLAIVAFVFTLRWFLDNSFTNHEGNNNFSKFSALLICFSTGIGWMLPTVPQNGSIDTWQVEAITFLSLYLYPHFIVSFILLLGAYGFLIKAELEKSLIPAAYAGLCLLLLTLIHTYDIITVAIATIVYLILNRMLQSQPTDLKSILGSVSRFALAGLIALPGFLYVTWEYNHDPLLASQNLPVQSAPILSVAEGFGLISVFALTGLWLTLTSKSKLSNNQNQNDDPKIVRSASLFVASWAIGSIIAIYLPFAFQRKLIEGVHIPLCILAAVGFKIISERIKLNSGDSKIKLAQLGFIGLTSIGLFVYMNGDIIRINQNNIYHNREFLDSGEFDALNWVKWHTPSDSIVQALPRVALSDQGAIFAQDATLQYYVPCLTLRHEYVGHWSLTPQAEAREFNLLIGSSTVNDPSDSIARLKATGINYIIFSQKKNPNPAAIKAYGGLLGYSAVPSYYELVYSNPDADVYKLDFSSPR